MTRRQKLLAHIAVLASLPVLGAMSGPVSAKDNISRRIDSAFADTKQANSGSIGAMNYAEADVSSGAQLNKVFIVTNDGRVTPKDNSPLKGSERFAPSVVDDTEASADATVKDVPASCYQPSPYSVKEVKAAIVRHAIDADVDPRLALAIADQESRFDRNRVSPKGAMGAMQLMPATARRLGVTDPCDPEQNIAGGIQYLRELIDEFKHPMLVMAAYNAGEHRIYEYGGLPPFRETLNYVVAVSSAYYGFETTEPQGGTGGQKTKLTAEASTSQPTPAGDPSLPDGARWIKGHVLQFSD